MSTTPEPPRLPDLLRHLRDLREDGYDGATTVEERLGRFERAVDLLDPVVGAVMAEFDAHLLAGTGSVRLGREYRDGRPTARWELSWELQRAARARDGRPLAPVNVLAWYGPGALHPHLRGTPAQLMWPLQVADAEDAARQEPVVRAIVEAELHQRIYEGGWHVVPAAHR